MDNLIIDLFNKNIITLDNNTINCKFNNLISYPYLINTKLLDGARMVKLRINYHIQMVMIWMKNITNMNLF